MNGFPLVLAPISFVVAFALVQTGCSPEGRNDAASCTGERWVGAFAAAPSDGATSYTDQSLRVVVTPLRAGSVARLHLSNRFGRTPVTFRNVHLGLQAAGASLVTGTNQLVRFGGQPEVTVPSGAEIDSDAIPFAVAAYEHLAVSFYVSGSGATEHAQGRQTSYFADASGGDLAASELADGFVHTTTTRPFVMGIDVLASAREGVVVAIGDSITDGAQTDSMYTELSVDTDARYPDFLARRLEGNAAGLSVINMGIGGNRVLSDAFLESMGPSLLARIDADVLARTDVTDVIILEGINDLSMPPAATAEDLITGLESAVAIMKASRPHGAPLNVLVGTITPAGGVTGFTASWFVAAEPNRQQVNAYIRTHGIGDGTVDFDAAVRDPADPIRIASAFDGGDGLHFSPAGYQQLASAVDLALLRGRGCALAR